METNEPLFDLQTLVQGYVDDLRAAAESPGDAPAQSAGNERLRESARLVEAGRDQAMADLNATYRARTSAMEAVVAERERRLEAYAMRQRQAVPADPNRFIVAGRVTDQVTGHGLPHVRVRATDLDRRHDDVVGEARTDALGYYRIEYTAAVIDERDQNPETYIEVLDNEGKVLFTSTKSFIQKAGQSAFIPAAVDGWKLPTSQRMAEKVARSVARRRQDLARRGRVLTSQPRVEVVRESDAREDDGRGNDRRKDAAPRPGSQVGRANAPAKKTEAPAEKARRKGQSGASSKPEAKSKQKTRARAAKPRSSASSRPLSDVKGIGPVYQERLASAGITDIETIAALEPSQLASVLEAGVGRAERIVNAAQAAAQPEEEPGDQA